jgi:putative transposase
MSFHNKLRVYVHYVWATWDRQELITEEVERPLHRCVQAICERCGCPVLAINGMSDHVHVMVKMSNTISMADLMEKVKGGSSRFVSDELKPNSGFKWQGSYGAFSVSPHERQKVISYIENQKRRHGDGTVWPHGEETREFVDTSRAVVDFAPTKVGAQPQAPQRQGSAYRLTRMPTPFPNAYRLTRVPT